MVVSQLHMWITLGLMGILILFYVTEWISLELSSLSVLAALIGVFHFIPAVGADGLSLLSATDVLAGFGNPALITVLSLLVVGEALIRTGALDSLAEVVSHPKLRGNMGLFVVLLTVFVLSAFLNNTPVVVIFIPILEAIARQSGFKTSRVMMSLSYVAILGGMTTVMGSSTNLLVSNALIDLGEQPFSFFEFTPIALLIGCVGLVYGIVIVPRILPDRESIKGRITEHGKQFVSQICIPLDSGLIGQTAQAGQFKYLPDVTVRMIQRGEHAELPPFDNYEIKAGDVLVLAATRKALAEVTSHDPELFMPPVQMGSDTSAERQRRHKENGEVHEISPGERDQVLVEAMIGPSSRMIGQALHQIGFRQRYKGIVIGVQRKARMIRARMTEIRLEAGDVLLIQTQSSHIDLLRADRDMVLLSGTLGVLPARTYAKRAALIFAGALAAAITGVVPIVLAALAGAGLMLAANTINLRQAARALDMRIMLVVAASLALGKAMDVTGGASYIATHVIDLFGGFGVYPILSVFFLLVALFTNILSNNACAVLFTPIALSLAQQLHADARIFAITVVLAANCSFASPVGYQTNLLVMGPGRYQFADFVRAGLPLVLLLWLSFTLFAPIIWPL